MQQRKRQRFMMGFMAIGATTAIMTTSAQAVSSNGPYYATPSWDQKLPASTRFVVLLDWNSEAVLDRETGLVWEKSPATITMDWQSARTLCLDKVVGGRIGWRLPSVVELTSLVDPSVRPGPTLPIGHPFTNVQSSEYWSATALAESRSFARSVRFNAGDVSTWPTGESLLRWCVRGPMNADAY